MLLDGNFEIPPTVIISLAPYRKHAARLFLEAGADNGGPGHRSPEGIVEFFQIAADAVEKLEIDGREENPAESTLDETRPSTQRLQEALQSRTIELEIAVFDCCLRDFSREVQEIGTNYPLPHALQEIRYASAAQEGIRRAVEIEGAENSMNPR